MRPPTTKEKALAVTLAYQRSGRRIDSIGGFARSLEPKWDPALEADFERTPEFRNYMAAEDAEQKGLQQIEAQKALDEQAAWKASPEGIAQAKAKAREAEAFLAERKEEFHNEVATCDKCDDQGEATGNSYLCVHPIQAMQLRRRC